MQTRVIIGRKAWTKAQEKDRLEAEVCHLVCDEHAMTLSAARALFLGDWTISYRQIFNEPP